MNRAADQFLEQMAAAFAGERRADADDTAAVLRARTGILAPAASECPDDAAIRALLATSPAPVATAALWAHDALGWGVDPVAAEVRRVLPNTPYAVSNLLGPDALLPCGHLRAGLYYQRPNTRYGLHSHAAVETYVIIAGAALWTAGDAQRRLGPGDYVHHATYLPHACETGAEGVVALWRWSGDIDTASYRVHDGHGAFAA